MAKVVVVIPTFNEKDNTLKMIDALAEEFESIKKHEIELLYVDGNSPDGTSGVVKEKMKKYKWLHLLVEKEKEGLGPAYVKGFKYAMNKLGADYVMEFDGDFQHRPDQIKNLVAEIDNGYEYIIGSRYIPGGSIPKEWGINRKLLSVVGNLVARVGLLMPQVHDLTTGFKLTKVKGVLDKIDLEHLYSRSFAYKLHILAAAVSGGAKVKEVPINFMARTQGESKLIKNELMESLKVIFLFQIHNPKIIRFVKFGIVGFTGFLVNYIGLELLRRTQLTASIASAFDGISFLRVLSEPTFWATLIATELAIISNFTFNNLWTFKDKMITKFTELIAQFVKFNVSSLFAVIVQPIIVTIFVILFSDTSVVRLLALIFALIFVIIPYNYIVYNLFIWKTWNLSRLLGKN